MLTEIAIQLKSLSFLLGLGGFFSMTKSALTGLFLLPGYKDENRVSIQADIDRVKKQVYGAAVAMLVLFVAACWIYFGLLGDLDADALRAGKATLSALDRKVIVGLIVIAIAFIVIDVIVTLKQREVSALASEA